MLTQSNSERRIQATGPIDGRMKVIDPLLSSGPSTPVQVVRWSDSEVCVRVARRVLVGATVHLRTADKTIIGEVRHGDLTNGENEIRILVKDLL
jgi:hypothetical protein